MFQRKQTRSPQPARTTTAGQRVLESVGISAGLPKTLLTKTNGQVFQEIQIGLPGGKTNQPNMLQQMELLQRAEPVGGWEAIINENKTRVLENVLEQLEKRLAEPGRAEAVKPLLAEILDAAEKLKRELEEQHKQIEARYDQVHAPLRSWQEESGREPDLFSRMMMLAQAVLGGQLSISQVVKLWNKRETLAKARDAVRAASELIARVIATVEEYARNLDAVIVTARQRVQELKQLARDLTNELGQTRAWTFQSDYARIADAFGAGEDGALLAEALRGLREQGGDKLLEVIATIARREAERELGALDIIQLIEKESAHLQAGQDLDAFDPVLLVGENLLDQVRHQNPTWRLVTNARPREFVLQITPNGEMVYDHPGLETARYGERTDRLGFLEAQLDTALDEIQVIRDSAEAFKHARAKREYFILEPIIQAWDDAKPAQLVATTKEPVAPRASAIQSQVAMNLISDDGHSPSRNESPVAQG
jgi:hypothetical protein